MKPMAVMSAEEKAAIKLLQERQAAIGPAAVQAAKAAYPALAAPTAAAVPGPAPGTAEVQVTVKTEVAGRVATPSTVSLDGQSKSCPDGGTVTFTGLKPGSYTLKVSAPAWTTFTKAITVKAGDVDVETVQLALAPTDPLTVISNALTGLVDSIFPVLQAAGQAIAGPFEDQINKALTSAQAKIADAKAAQAAHKPGGSDWTVEDEALALTSVIVAGNVALGVVGVIADLMHPLKTIGAMEVIKQVLRDLGLSRMSARIAMLPVRLDLLQRLTYYYNSKFTPLVPAEATVVSLRHFGTLKDDQYHTLMAMHGYSEATADVILADTEAKYLASDQSAVARAAGTVFTKGKMTLADFKAVLTKMNITGARQDLWVYRYQMARKQGLTAAELAVIEGTTAT